VRGRAVIPEATDLTTEEVAGRLRKPVESVQAWLRSGQLRGYRVGRHWRVPVAALDEFCRGNWRQQTPGRRKERNRREASGEFEAKCRRNRERLRAEGLLT
jgi:excisionase family DNA binding protein